MRIALVNSEYHSPGGIGTYTENIAKALAEAGHTVHILQKEGVDAFASHPGIRRHRVGRKPAQNVFFRALGYRLFWEINLHLEFARGVAHILERLFEDRVIDIAEIPDFLGEGFLFRKNRWPFVCRLHTPWQMVRRWNGLPTHFPDRFVDFMERTAFRSASAISSPSRALLDCFPWKRKTLRAEVIPYPLESAWAQPLPGPFTLEILFLGRLEKRKGIDWFCGVTPRILEKYPFAGIRIAGEKTPESEPYLRELEKTIEERGWKSRVMIEPPLPHAAVRAAVRRAAVVAAPSRFDNFPNVVLEAMSEGCLVVAARSGGIPEMVDDGSTGLLFSPEDGETGLFEKLAQALDDSGLRTRLGQAARESAWRRYAPSVVARRTVSFYSEVLGQWKR